MTKNEKLTIRPNRLLIRFDIITLSIALLFLTVGKIAGEVPQAVWGFVVGILLPQFILDILLKKERMENNKEEEDELWQ